jgi:hypothetical protein
MSKGFWRDSEIERLEILGLWEVESDIPAANEGDANCYECGKSHTPCCDTPWAFTARYFKCESHPTPHLQQLFRFDTQNTKILAAFSGCPLDTISFRYGRFRSRFKKS